MLYTISKETNTDENDSPGSRESSQGLGRQGKPREGKANQGKAGTPNLPTIIPTRIAWLKLSGKSPMGMRVPHLNIKILLESDPPTSRILLRPVRLLRVSISEGLTQADSSF